MRVDSELLEFIPEARHLPSLLRLAEDAQNSANPEPGGTRDFPSVRLVHEHQVSSPFQSTCEGGGFAGIKMFFEDPDQR